MIYASDLKAKVANAARAICIKTGVKTAQLLHACAVDVAVLGTKQAVRFYLDLPKKVNWGKSRQRPHLRA